MYNFKINPVAIHLAKYTFVKLWGNEFVTIIILLNTGEFMKYFFKCLRPPPKTTERRINKFQSNSIWI